MDETLSRITATIFVCCFAALSAFGQQIESGKLFQGQNISLYYEVRGAKSGTPLIVVNGGPGVDHTYMHFTLQRTSAFDELAKSRPVIFYDQRGVARSPALKPGQSCTFADQIADLDALRAYLGYERIDLLGHSYGGLLAMAYATRYPERIVHLILADSAAPKFSDTTFLFDKIFPETSERIEANTAATETEIKAFMLDYLSMLFYSPANRNAYLAKVKNPTRNMPITIALGSELQKVDLNPEIAKISFPTFVVTGRFDVNVAPLVAYKIHKAIPHSRFFVFEHSGHLPFYEEQKEFVRLLEGFLSVK